MTDDREAGQSRKGATKRQAAKSPGGAKQSGTKTVRLQLHLMGQTVERLRVHTALSHRNDSRVADEILASWLTRYGKGRELFDGEDRGDLSGEIGSTDAA